MTRALALCAFGALTLTGACAPAPAQGTEAKAAMGALVAAQKSDDVVAVLSDDVVIVDGDERLGTGGAARLLGLALTSGVDAHHDVLRASVTRDGDERLFFGALDGDELRLAILFAPPPDGALGDDDAAVHAYEAAWNADGAPERDALLARCWAEDGREVDPQNDVERRDGLAGAIAAFHSQVPGGRVTGTSALAKGGGALHFRWLTTGMGGLVSSEGVDVGLFDGDGRIGFIAGFYGPLPALE